MIGAQGDEFTHLPAIVDAAESSPAAAKEAAVMVRKYLSKDNYSKGYAQYNAIMLTRILADNPARPFTQNFDKSFISTTKELLREGKDLSVQQILRETLDYMEAEKLKTNDSLTPLVEMWRKEKSKTARIYGNYAVSADLWNTMGDTDDHVQNQRRTSQNYNGQYQANPHRRQHGLPPPDELVSRIEEAKTTARLLLQTIQSTPSSEVLSNDLIKEFADRAKSAQRSIQGYMNSENPRPDEDTMLTLIETSDQLNIAMSKHQRALLQARKSTGSGTTSPQPQTDPSQPPQTQYSQPQPQRAYSGYNAGTPQQGSENTYGPPPGPPPNARGAVRSQDYGYNSSTVDENRQFAPQTTQTAHYGVADNPFSDDAALPPPPPQQKTYNLFDNSYPSSQPTGTHSGYEQQQPQQQQTDSIYSQSQRPAGGWGGTQSYMNRQESATTNLTMHGASPPPERQI